jgi:ribosome hibernation promoting factor
MRVEIRGRHIEVTDEIRRHGERSLAFALARFGLRIESVRVYLLDVNGPRGGVDKCCRIDVRLRPTGSVFVEGAASGLRRALDRAAGRAGRTVGRTLRRERSRRLDPCQLRTGTGRSTQLQPDNLG